MCRDRQQHHNHGDLILSVLKSPLRRGGGGAAGDELNDTNFDVSPREDDVDNDTADEEAR